MADTRTENDALIETAQEAIAQPEAIDVTQVHSVVLPDGVRHEIVDLERFLNEPRRKRERVELHEAGSFAEYVVRHRVEATTTLYADLEHSAIVAVLNDSAAGEPGWGDHRATLTLRKTQPWEHWTSLDGKQLGQEQFAEHIEAGLQEIAAPPAMEMYELAQTFQATVGASFKQAGRLADGRRTLHFDETINASAGEQGDLDIPKEFILHVTPFEGGPDYELTARLRFKVREARLTFTYILVRPEDVLREAFDATLEAIEKGTGITAFRGTPPVRPA
jgi:uncharacterized protein YfdQ (DUF2303 family)